MLLINFFISFYDKYIDFYQIAFFYLLKGAYNFQMYYEIMLQV